jgi:hypothetical protein
MSGTQSQIPAGLGATDEDFQRIADTAAFAEDRALRLLAAVGGAKRVLPLTDFLAQFDNEVGILSDRGSLSAGTLCVFDGGSPTGRLFVQPAAYLVNVAAVPPLTGEARIIAVKPTTATVGPFSSTAGGRCDVVYATVTMGNGLTASRRWKDPTTGERSTQSVLLTKVATVTFNIAPGTEGAPNTVPAIPADSGTAWNIPLANVLLQAGYTSGDTLTTYGIGPATHKTRQVWARAVLPPSVVGSVRMGRVNPVSGVAASADLPFHRLTGRETVVCSFRHTGGSGGSPAEVTLDRGRDYRTSMVRIGLSRVTAQGTGTVYPAPSRVKDGGASEKADSLWLNTGWDDTGSWFWNTGGTPDVRFYVGSSDGRLYAKIPAAPIDGGGDEYVVVVEVLDSFMDGRTTTP